MWLLAYRGSDNKKEETKRGKFPLFFKECRVVSENIFMGSCRGKWSDRFLAPIDTNGHNPATSIPVVIAMSGAPPPLAYPTSKKWQK
jgi:hypothetical protein